MRPLTLLICALSLLLPGCGCDGGKKPTGVALFGRFEGDVITKWLEDGRKMQLQGNFAYFDPNNKRWFAPKDSIIDGASIPQAFWTVIGGPFEGEFRNASVVHDVACTEMKEKWEDVHLMFYHACRCGGVSETKAKIMYAAVYQFGPRWETVMAFSKNTKDTPPRPIRRTMPQPSADTARKYKERIERTNPSLEELKTLRVD
jgi:hypothetical protein